MYNLQNRYQPLMPMTISVLVNILGEPNDQIKEICSANGIDTLQKPMITTNVFKKIGKMLINSCGEATLLLKNVKCDHINTNKVLWENLMRHVYTANDPDLIDLVMDNINAIIKCVCRILIFITNLTLIIYSFVEHCKD